MLACMAYDPPPPDLLTIPPPDDIREMIRTRLEEVRTLKRLLRLSEAALEAQSVLASESERGDD
jgi:hypothetical protein